MATNSLQSRADVGSAAVPLALNRDDLQQAAFERFGYSPLRTIGLAQSLYEKGLIFYPRTECRYLPSALYEDALIMATQRAALGTDPVSITKPVSPAWDDSKVGAHHGLAPTKLPVAAIFGMALSPEESNVYGLIHARFFELV